MGEDEEKGHKMGKKRGLGEPRGPARAISAQTRSLTAINKRCPQGGSRSSGDALSAGVQPSTAAVDKEMEMSVTGSTPGSFQSPITCKEQAAHRERQGTSRQHPELSPEGASGLRLSPQAEGTGLSPHPQQHGAPLCLSRFPAVSLP